MEDGGDSFTPFALLIIDPQADFHQGGSLAVPGADDDAQRIQNFVEGNLDNITNIYVTLDSHQRVHISHPLFWKDANGASPAPFTPILHTDVVAGKWMAADETLKAYAEDYTLQLETSSGKFQHIVWPEHCLIGSPGHCVVPPVLAAIHAWSAHTRKPIRYYWKGTNIRTEMYSVFKAEVPVPGCAETEVNEALVRELVAEPRVMICGQALSHCVNFSTRDLLAAWPEGRMDDLTLLAGMSSPVIGFEGQAVEFLGPL